jgi:hypothetical protein
MDRDEVLDAVELAACEHDAHAVGLRLVDKVLAAKWHECESEKLRAAAELIRQGGWRPIAEAPEDRLLWCGCWEWMANETWQFINRPIGLLKEEAIRVGYTHYLPEPEPPAREVERG